MEVYLQDIFSENPSPFCTCTKRGQSCEKTRIIACHSQLEIPRKPGPHASNLANLIQSDDVCIPTEMDTKSEVYASPRLHDRVRLAPHLKPGFLLNLEPGSC